MSLSSAARRASETGKARRGMFALVERRNSYALTLEQQEQFLAQRKAELGYTGNDYVPVNAGARRTESKRQLLRTLADVAEERGEAPRFAANIG